MTYCKYKNKKNSTNPAVKWSPGRYSLTEITQNSYDHYAALEAVGPSLGKSMLLNVNVKPL